MARQSLGGMLGTVNINEPATDKPDPAAETVAPRPIQSVPEPAEPSTKPPAKPRPQPSEGAKRGSPTQRRGEPKYLTYERKEARLSDEQLDKLTGLTRRINKRRRGTGERITDNTLIRVAVDLLLTRAGDLTGTTETELRRSLGL